MASSSSSSSSMAEAASLLVPWFFNQPALNDSDPREFAIFVHCQTRSVTLLEGALDDESIIREISPRGASFPATKASIESLPRFRVSKSGLECAICLAEVNVEATVKVMPCGHKFHSGCIDEWLGIRGTCPNCRFSMPVELRKEGGGWRIHTFYLPDTTM